MAAVSLTGPNWRLRAGRVWHRRVILAEGDSVRLSDEAVCGARSVREEAWILREDRGAGARALCSRCERRAA